MTLQELEAALERIPKTGALNIAKRRMLLARIYELMNREEQK